MDHTTKKDSEKINYSLKKKFVSGICLIIIPILGLVFTWIGFRIADQGKKETLEKARVIADQIVMTRQWITDCMGGVFVNTDSPGSTGVNFATEDRISNGSDTYRLFTPSMVTQKLSRYSFEKKAYQFRLSSLTPINQANAPNPFEKTALLDFKKNKAPEYYRFSDTSLEYMIPLYNTKGCVKCHTRETRLKTSIIGGLRVTIPYGELKASLQKNIGVLALAGIAITLTTVMGLVFLVRILVLNPIDELDQKSRELSSGDLSTRVRLKTGDELEKLGTSFNLMAENLMHSRDSLEEKVARATQDLAQANHELLKLDRIKSDFLASMSHELRTPLTAVKGSITYLERTLTEPEHLEFIRIIEKNISRLTRMISSLFDLTRLEAGTVEWEFEPADLSQLAADVAEIMAPQALGKQIQIELDCPDKLTAIIDFERMEQVLVNLVDNAVKFSETGSKIRIRLAASKGEIEISVQNKGPGIPAHHLETVFKKFYTAESGANGKNQGAGMGLAISKAIVEAHKGSIQVESSPGAATTFTVRLPKEQEIRT